MTENDDQRRLTALLYLGVQHGQFEGGTRQITYCY